MPFHHQKQGPIYQPQEDQNKLLALYYYKFPKSNTVEITLVFSGEDHPCWLMNKIYTLYRIFRYRRITDIETFYVETEGGRIQKINFSYRGIGTYSSKQTYYTLNPKHYLKQSLYSELQWYDNRPCIYINTWNHLFAERNNNPDLSYIGWIDYPTFIGTREKAESDFRLKLMGEICLKFQLKRVIRAKE